LRSVSCFCSFGRVGGIGGGSDVCCGGSGGVVFVLGFGWCVCGCIVRGDFWHNFELRFESVASENGPSAAIQRYKFVISIFHKEEKKTIRNCKYKIRKLNGCTVS